MRTSSNLILRFLVPGLLAAAPLTAPGAQAQTPDPGLFSALKARSIGPSHVSGRITSIDALESDPNLVFVGAATGGVWKSENAGQTWTPIFDDQEVLSVGAVAVFQDDPTIIWVGTGEAYPRDDHGMGGGVFKSTDGGATWSLLGLERSERIRRILLHPTNPDIAYAAVLGPAWSGGEERGVYRTRDGGATWERILFVDERTGAGDLVMDPSDPRVLLAGMCEAGFGPWSPGSRGPGSGLYRSEDGGDTWVQTTPEDGFPSGELGHIGLAVARNRPEVMYALVEAGANVLVRSGDGGRSWAVVNDRMDVGPGLFGPGAIVADPGDEMRVLALQSRLTGSRDGGRTFQDITGPLHPGVQILWIAPSDPRLMYAGTDGGVYLSRDGGDHWSFVDNLPVSQFNRVSVDSETPFNVYGGAQENGSWRGPSDVWRLGGIRADAWEAVGSGSGSGTLVDPTDPALGYSTSQEAGLVRFDLRTGERKGIQPWAPEGIHLRFNGNSPMAGDFFQDGVLYYGSQFVHKTGNRGQSWEILSGDLTGGEPATLVALAPSPVEPEVIWAGSDDGLVHLTRSGGGDWEEVGRRIRGVPEGSWVAHIEASHHRPGMAWVVFDEPRRGNGEPYLFLTEDYGRRWRRFGGGQGLPGSVRTLVEDPLSPNLLFAGTESGLFVSLNQGAGWFPWRHGLPAVPVPSLVVHPRDHDLVVGTHGRGIYILDDIRPLRDLADDPGLLGDSVHLFEPPPAFLRSQAPEAGNPKAGDTRSPGEARPFGAILTYSVGTEMAGRRALVEILEPDGTVIRSFQGPGRRGLNRVTWDLRETSPLEEAGEWTGGPTPGVEVLPGVYGVRVRIGEAVSFQRLAVVTDPRVEIPLADRILRRDAVREGLHILLALQRVQEGLRVGREGLAGLGGPDGVRIPGIQLLVDSVGAEVDRIGRAASDAQGDRGSLLALGSIREAPTEAERIGLARTRNRVDGVVARFNALVFGRLNELKEAVAAAGMGELPSLRPVPRGYGGRGEGGQG